MKNLSVIDHTQSKNISFEFQGERFIYPDWLMNIVGANSIESALSRHAFRVVGSLDNTRPYLGRKNAATQESTSSNIANLTGGDNVEEFSRFIPYPFSQEIGTDIHNNVDYTWRVGDLEVRGRYDIRNIQSGLHFLDTITAYPYPIILSMYHGPYRSELLCLAHAIYAHRGIEYFI